MLVGSFFFRHLTTVLKVPFSRISLTENIEENSIMKDFTTFIDKDRFCLAFELLDLKLYERLKLRAPLRVAELFSRFL